MKVFACGYTSEPRFRSGGWKGIKSRALDERTYKWKHSSRIKVRSKVSALHAETGRGYFITLTQHVSIESNKPIALFLDNLKKQGYVRKFVWVRERQQRGANHYHVYFTSDKWLFDSGENSRRALAKIFQEAWNSAVCTCGGVASLNSLRFGKRPVVYGSCGQIGNYLTKYMTKGGSNEPEKIRLYASSNGIEYVVSIGVTYQYLLGRSFRSKQTEFANITYYSVDDRWWLTAIEIAHHLNTNFIDYGFTYDVCSVFKK